MTGLPPAYDAARPNRLWPSLMMGAAIVWSMWIWSAPAWHNRRPSIAAIASAAAYRAGAILCHQRSERSFERVGVPLPVCARCTGVYVGSVLGLAVAAWGRRRRMPAREARVWLGLAVIPSVATAVVEWSGAFNPGNWGRAAAALPAGAGAALLIGRALNDVRWADVVQFCAWHRSRASGASVGGQSSGARRVN
ncbi:MAG: DUF2085 domain-containing protein [Vicinamibacterales bacterium]